MVKFILLENNNGQLGLGHNNNINKPTMIESLQNKNIEKIRCLISTSYAITSNFNFI